MREIPLAGGDMNVVVRVGDTVRRPPEPPEVVELLQWYERVGFDGAPRFLGYDEQGREMLSFVEGDPGFAPVPSSDDVVAELGRLLRRAHDAQKEFTPGGLVIGHCDLFWTNVIFRDGLPVALIDWELARPVTRTLEIGLAATYWAAIRIDELIAYRRERIEHGLWRGATPIEVIRENLAWTESHAAELGTFLA